jgi:hypothetical protein
LHHDPEQHRLGRLLRLLELGEARERLAVAGGRESQCQPLPEGLRRYCLLAASGAQAWAPARSLIDELLMPGVGEGEAELGMHDGFLQA